MSTFFLDDQLRPNDEPSPAEQAAELLTPIAAAAGEPDQGPALMFASADEWLREWMLPNWIPPREAHNSNTIRWCRRWWLHPEAVNRIEALWRAWEHLRLDGLTGPSVWWRDHFDHHWPIVTASNGPFEACARGEHGRPADPLAADPSPIDLNDFTSEG